ncbi:RES domain-containing protein [Salinibacter sp.]|uniref:RES domain-containing protein n=1 Tax=Salinibacter sp. TaxID=2065818 RepID=UPI003D743CA6
MCRRGLQWGGARQPGGRFNSLGYPVVYTSEFLALTQLEILVNLPIDRLLSGYRSFRADIPNRHTDILGREELSEG